MKYLDLNLVLTHSFWHVIKLWKRLYDNISILVAALITDNLISHALRLKLWDKADQIDYVCINSIIGHAYFVPVLIWWTSSIHELWPRFATCHLRMLDDAGAYGSLITTKRFSINTSWQKIKLYANKRCGGHFKVL